jgi:ubiquinol-cytochrome c reductase subunit 9
MSLLARYLKTFQRRNSVFLGTVFASAFVFEMFYDTVIGWAWEHNNDGVNKIFF